MSESPSKLVGVRDANCIFTSLESLEAYERALHREIYEPVYTKVEENVRTP